jgi:hypothetical protein
MKLKPQGVVCVSNNFFKILIHFYAEVVETQGGSNKTGTNCDLFTYK